MTDPQPTGSGLGNALYDEAAEWFAKMRGPHAPMHKSSFEAWLSRGAVHRAAYNRVAEIFTDSGRVDDPDARTTDLRKRKKRSLAQIALVIAIGAIAAAALFPLFSSLLIPVSEPAGGNHRPDRSLQSLASNVGDIRRVQLSDGSTIILDTDSLVTVMFTGAERRLRLVRGRARFEVAHETRPFRVTAGEGIVTARGTIFDVRIDPMNKASVVLLRGAVDVALSGKTKALTQRLRPGEATSYRQQFTHTNPVAVKPSGTWMEGKGEFHDVPLIEVVAEANRYSAVQIFIADPADQQRRVSGIFSLKDPQRLSERLADLFHLGRRVEADRIILEPRPQPARK